MSGSPYDTYTSPLATRNASPEMLRLWSARLKFNTWRKIWLAVAEAQHELTRVSSGGTGVPPVSSEASKDTTGGTPVPPGNELVTREQVEELKAVVNRPGGITDEEIRAAEKYERELRHDVMAHVHALGDSCPKAKGIVHLGMTSQDVVCNADLLIITDALRLVENKLSNVFVALGLQAEQHARLATLGFTHYQPAQPVTVGRRFAQWASEVHALWFRMFSANDVVRLRGLRGATGTQASFLALCGGSGDAVDRLEASVIARLLGDPLALLDAPHMADTAMARLREAMAENPFPSTVSPDEGNERMKSLFDTVGKLGSPRGYIDAHAWRLSGQTYPRVFDTHILADLASCASVLHKIATDIRLLCNRKELDEPFEHKQIGSSAMPYKRNPMRCERICGLARFVMNLVGNAYDTAATQWLERTLDDSSNRRLSLPEAFLALDGALDLMHNVASGLIVHEAMVRKNLMAELPFMATENIMMACVRLGGDRQHYHELIRVHAQAAGLRVKDEGLDNDLLERLKNDKAFWSKARGGPLSAELDWDGVMDPMKYIGRSVEQTERFIMDVVEPLRKQYGEAIAKLGQSGPKV